MTQLLTGFFGKLLRMDFASWRKNDFFRNALFSPLQITHKLLEKGQPCIKIVHHRQPNDCKYYLVVVVVVVILARIESDRNLTHDR